MKKLALLLMLCTILFTGCGKTVKDIKVTSFDVVSVTPRGLSELLAVVEVGVDNPVVSFTVKDVVGYIKMDGAPCLNLTADQIMVDARCEKTYTIPVRAGLDKGFNPFQLLTMLQNRDISRFTVSVSAKIILRTGVGRTFELNDVPMDKLISLR